MWLPVHVLDCKMDERIRPKCVIELQDVGALVVRLQKMKKTRMRCTARYPAPSWTCMKMWESEKRGGQQNLAQNFEFGHQLVAFTLVADVD